MGLKIASESGQVVWQNLKKVCVCVCVCVCVLGQVIQEGLHKIWVYEPSAMYVQETALEKNEFQLFLLVCIKPENLLSYILSFTNYLFQQYGIRGPFLVIAPLSTIANWQREFETWTDINAIVYHGSAQSRLHIQQYEMYYKDEKVWNFVVY